MGNYIGRYPIQLAHAALCFHRDAADDADDDGGAAAAGRVGTSDLGVQWSRPFPRVHIRLM